MIEGVNAMRLTRSGKITHTLTPSGKDILKTLHRPGTDYLPDSNATVEFHVPGGGDYSNERVNFLEEDRVIVSWTRGVNE